MAAKLHERYDEPLQAITLIGQCMTKALFAGNSAVVLFWAFVHAHYRGAAFDGDAASPIAQLSGIVIPDPYGNH
ncbi:MAG TPA: hypothetical protein VF534_39275 [Paraburkholderia sp.]